LSLCKLGLVARLQIYDCLASEWMTGFNLLKAASGAYNAGLYRPKTSDRKPPQICSTRIGFRNRDYRGYSSLFCLQDPSLPARLAFQMIAFEVRGPIMFFFPRFHVMSCGEILALTTSLAVTSLGWRENSGSKPALCAALQTLIRMFWSIQLWYSVG
jgi:hypothetical protein